MPQPLHFAQLPNGLTLLAEPMPWLESAAFALTLPAGCSRDPLGRFGLSSLTSEMIQRGCGERDSRQFIEDLENLGVDRSSSVSNPHSSYGGALLADKLYEVLGIYADLVQRPHLPEDELEEGRLGCIQEVRALEDDLAQRAMQELRRRQYPDPYGRSSQGTLESLEAITLDDVRSFFDRCYTPAGAILSIAGKIDWPELSDRVAELFGGWTPREPPPRSETPPPAGPCHLQHESNQTHIAVSYDSVPYRDERYYEARAAVGVLSDGMSSRLFTEVREVRGLCYTVYASYHSLLDRGRVMCYAGTTTERAQETLDVLVGELRKLSRGIEQAELDRLKARLKSSLVMQQESSSARAGSMAADWYFLGRVRTMDELCRIIDGLSVPAINAYLAAHPPREFTVVTLGAQSLEVPGAVS